MSQLQDLSNELVLDILEEVLPDDIVSVSLTSKRMYNLATPRREEHHRLRKELINFHTILQRLPNGEYSRDWLYADLLCKIVAFPRFGLYVKKMDLTRARHEIRRFWNRDAVFENHVSPSRIRLLQKSRTYMEIIEEAVRGTEIIPRKDVDHWLREVRARGGEDPLLALLLLHTPKLEMLSYSTLHSNGLLKAVQHIVAQDSAVKLYLSDLKEVRISFRPVMWNRLDCVKAFMSLPSLTSIKTDALFVSSRYHEASSARLPQSSNVTEMDFRRGFLPKMVISELLPGVKNLKRFTYGHSNEKRDDTSFECFDILSSLEANARHTLEYLEFGAVKMHIEELVLLRGFRALREIKFQTLRCFALEKNRPANLINFLPSSLEKLAVHWYHSTSKELVETMTGAFLDLVRKSKTQLPNLRELHLTTGSEKESDALRGCVARDETASINPLLSFDIRGPGGDGGYERPLFFVSKFEPHYL